MELLASDIHNVASVDMYDQPRIGLEPGEVRLRKDIHIRLKSGGEIVIYCYMGAING